MPAGAVGEAANKPMKLGIYKKQVINVYNYKTHGYTE